MHADNYLYPKPAKFVAGSYALHSDTGQVVFVELCKATYCRVRFKIGNSEIIRFIPQTRLEKLPETHPLSKVIVQCQNRTTNSPRSV